jgi:hypothetical protein
MLHSSDSSLFIHVFAPLRGDTIPEGRDASEQDTLVMSVAMNTSPKSVEVATSWGLTSNCSSI